MTAACGSNTETPPPSEPAGSLDSALVEGVIGIQGAWRNGRYKVTVPQNDLPVSVDGFRIVPPMGLGSWIAFAPDGNGALAMGDIVVREAEIANVERAALEHGLAVTGLHNHFVREDPSVKFMHVRGQGSAEDLARAARAVFDEVVRSRNGDPAASPTPSVPNTLDTDEIARILGHEGARSGGVYKVTIGRPDVVVTSGGVEVTAFMGLNTWAAWQGTPERAAVAGDFAMLQDEVEAVTKALVGHGIEVVAVHNHMLFESPRVFFLHYWGVGPAPDLAGGLRAALDVIEGEGPKTKDDPGAGASRSATADRAASGSPYLYVWAGAEDEADSDFLAVLDADPGSDRYGEVVASVPVGLKGGAHHSEHVMPAGDTMFVNAFGAGASFLVDLSDPLAPRVAGSFREMGTYTYPHTFERLPGGNVLATFQTKGEGNETAGGLVELDPAGRLVRAADAADLADPELRAYSVTPIPAIDRAVSTTSDMWAQAEGTSFQVWRLSDLSLLATVPLPHGPLGTEHRDPAEVRLLPDSATAIMTTFTCAMYLLHDLQGEAPRAELIHTMPWKTYDTDECGIPLARGRFWVQTYANANGSALISLDISDPAHPVEIDRLTLDEPWWPHWISAEPGGDRIVVTSGKGSTLHRVLIVRLDPETGGLALDSTFRDPGSRQPGVGFDRTSWPHGEAGPALPHGAVFSRLKEGG